MSIDRILLIAVLVAIVVSMIIPRTDNTSEILKRLNKREKIENKLIIIDNETIEKLRSNDTIIFKHDIDSVFARFKNVVIPTVIR